MMDHDRNLVALGDRDAEAYEQIADAVYFALLPMALMRDPRPRVGVCQVASCDRTAVDGLCLGHAAAVQHGIRVPTVLHVNDDGTAQVVP